MSKKILSYTAEDSKYILKAKYEDGTEKTEKVLSYTVEDDGYIIYDNKTKWIDQRGFIPSNYIDLDDESFERSAQLNIIDILDGLVQANEEENGNLSANERAVVLETQLEETNEVLLELLFSNLESQSLI